ncbi:molybdopterin oxidoreductase [Oceanicola granulosus HTCC2516]|uniref:Molybdopterin oxidoreductase n=1 Tax=Oceanicola granulosus (strain ATCC BAA-861 / DSM 15982 / KCTC 12143 / HTCC2516) TaxID=314256 RepID=Q2CEE0_OCEGH|nr:molybdopterin-dependent oxidoreductase [Oceanicola granulosus]EAR51057.1 molybdopterin oxidoreductase [Oceanicola granulosus HTCC2516]
MNRSDDSFIVHRTRPLNAEPTPTALMSGFFTPQHLFYIRSHGDTPELPADHEVRLSGLVTSPLRFSLERLRREFPKRKVIATLQCAGNRRAEMQDVRQTSGDPWRIGAVGTAEWTGVALADVLAKAGIDETRARHVAFRCADVVDIDGEIAPYEVSISVERAMAGDVLVAWALNGEDLDPAHGAPMRIIVPGYAGARSAKWLLEIDVRDAPSDSPVQARDYKLFPPSVARQDANWDEGVTIEQMPVTSAICLPRPDEPIPPGRTTVKGYAMAYGRKVARVDVSTDGGRSWRQAGLMSERTTAAWTLWALDVDLPAGRHELVVKAVDEAGQSQPECLEGIWNFAGYLATAWHRVIVDVG